MKKVRMIYAVLLMAFVVLVSVRGGTILWFLYYFMLSIPVLALLYVLYIYLRLCIRQQVARYVNKGEYVPYKLEIANEDLLLMSGIKLNFYAETSQVQKKNSNAERVSGEGEAESFSLLPHQCQDLDLEICCKYRGTYPVGVKSVSVTDFFGLFTITYPVLTPVRLTARPRILNLAKLLPKLEKRDPKKNRPVVSRLQEMLDFELKKYTPGDPLRHIHWKNSARAGELLVRRQAPQELYEFVVVMDCTFLENKTDPERMQIEDNILEMAVALVYDACMGRVRSRVVWCADRICDMQINDKRDFDKFYNLCAELPFEAAMTLEEIWAACEQKMGGNPAFRLVGCNPTPELTQKIDKSRRLGRDVVLIDTGEAPL